MRKVTLFIVAVAIAIVIYAMARHGTSGFKAGNGPAAIHSAAPDFSLEDLEGKPLALSNYRGQVVLLNFWATWCTPCRDEIPHFIELQDKYRSQGFQLIGISMDDSPKPVLNFYRTFKMNYPVAMGSAKLGESYGGVLGLPISFLIGRDGRIAAKYRGSVEIPVLEQQINSLLQAR